MKINLLITGGLGYIGSFTAKNIFARNKKKPYIVDNSSDSMSLYSTLTASVYGIDFKHIETFFGL